MAATDARTISLDPPPVLTAEETRAQTEAALQPTEEPTEEKERPGKTHTWHFKKFSRWYDKELEGTFENRILTPRQEIEVGSIRSRLLAASFTAALDSDASMTAEKISHLEVSLKEKPDWFQPLKFEDKEILDDIYMEVASHEARFWGREDRLFRRAAAGSD